MFEIIAFVLVSLMLTMEVMSQVSHTILTETSGTIVSPNYDGNYPSDADCSWTIRLPQGWFIGLRFEDLSIEDEPNCG